MPAVATLPDGLLARVLDAPDDDSPRLVFADWLDESGDPRGEFIRVQVARANLDLEDPRQLELSEREQLLLARHRRQWDQPLAGLADGWDYSRGFAETVRGSARRWLESAATLFGVTPVREAAIYDVSGHLTPLSQAGWLARLKSITVFAGHQPAVAPALAEADLPRLRELRLGRNNIDDLGVAALAAQSRFPELRLLDLSDNRISAVGARLLAGSSRFDRLEFLNLSLNPLSIDGTAAIIEGHHLRRLHVLQLARTQLDRAGAAHLASLPGLNRISTIDLGGNALGDLGTARLADSPYLSGLVELGLAQNDIGTDGLAALLAAPGLAGLRRLDLSGNRIDDAAIAQLVASPAWPALTDLELRDNPFRGAGIRALIQAPLNRPISRLRLALVQVDPWLFKPLQRRYGPALRID
ncbi:MAG: TIGR02996 domain-containing protein [Gemmataceae bacterium]|nr:TIGR02996 domain-containing protein [Gemmataceae bacterium]